MNSTPRSSHSSDLTGRDRRIVQLVARYQQASSGQIHQLLFPDVSSRTPIDRALKRLTDREFLRRVERRLVGGSRGGSGQYVYSLGSRGFYMSFTGKYSPVRTVRYHTLTIVDCVVILRKLERAGRFSIAGMSSEPDCWLRIGSNELKPDLYVDLIGHSGRQLKLWLEVDMGTEAQRHVKDKLMRYRAAYNEAEVDVFPRTVWVAVDDERAKELSWLISQIPTDAHHLFQVTTVAGLASLFGA